MINKLIEFSINNKFVIALFTIALIVGGVYSVKQVPVDAVPDITNNQVQIITQAPNLGTEDIEQFVTYPVEVAVANLPEVTEIRSISRFGLSVVTIVFSDDLDTYLPRQLVSEKLTEIKANIPEGFGTPFMGPISTGLGEIYQYTLEVDPAYKDRYDATELRTIQDWIIRRQMAMVSGVVEVNAFGGNAKQYEVSIDPNELKAIGLSINDVYEALEHNNQNTGGAYIEKNHQANFIRGEGLARSLDDIKNIVVANKGGIPITVKDIGVVQYGTATRYGALTKNGEGEAVGGMILMLKGASTDEVIKNVANRVSEIQKSLPEGVNIKPFLDRSKLIANTTSTVKTNLVEGALIVVFILVFFLGNWRGGLIVASTIPLSLLFAFILMHVFDVWANLMSLGAIDFGIIVDGSVIIVESTVFLIYQHMKKTGNVTAKNRDDITYNASSKMMNTAFFGQFIILIVFLPILALEGIEGKMFIPMALTFSFAMIGAMVLCLTYVPMITSVFLKAPKDTTKTYWGDNIVHWLEDKYESGLVNALKRGKLIVISAVILLGVSGFLFSKLGGEFIPQLDEGDLAFHAILKPGSSLSESIATTTKIEKIVKDDFPEVIDIISRIGVADVPTDPMPMDIADVFVILKPESEWTRSISKDELIAKTKHAVEQVPGVNFEFTQPIEMRFNELITGVREDIAVKLYGHDLNVLAEKAAEIGKIVASVDGVADMKVEAISGQPQITINYNRNKLAQYGLQINKLNKLIETAFAGGVAGTIFEGEKRFDLVVRLKEELRQDLSNVKNLFVSLPSGTQIPLKEVASISYKPGPMQISRDNTNRRTYVGINVRGRDIKSLVEEIQQKIEAQVKLPTGYYVRYGGAFENLERATGKLKTVVPLALGLIFILIFMALKSFKQTIMIYMAIPLATIGGVFSLVLRDMPFSISAGVGFIVLFGVAVLNGLVLISGFNELKEEGVLDVNERIKQGTKRRIRPILLTALTDMLGFLPMALSTSSGAEVQQPLATVVIGGLLTSTLLTLFVIPVLYKWMEKIEENKRPHRFQKPIRSVSIIIMLFCFGITQAQQTVTMEEAVAIAMEKYPSIEAAKLSVDKAKSHKGTVWDLGNTQLFTGADEIGNNNTPIYTSVGITQSNIDVFGIAPKSKLAKANIKVAESNEELTRLQLEVQVKSAWMKAYIAKRNYDSYVEIDSVYSRLNKALDLRFETELISKLEYTILVNQGKLIQLEKNKANSNYQIALQALNNWLLTDELLVVTPISIADFDTTETTSVVELKNHPLQGYWQSQLEVATAQKRVANSQFFPKLSGQYGVQRIGGQSGFYSYQVGVQIPLVFIKTRAKAKAVKLQEQLVAKENEVKETQLKTRFNSLANVYKQLKMNWSYYKNSALPLAKEQRNGALLSYKEGAIDYLAFLQNMKAAIALELDSWQALQEYQETKIHMEYFLNK